MRSVSTEGTMNFLGGLISSAGPITDLNNFFNDCMNVSVGLDGSVYTREPFSKLSKKFSNITNGTAYLYDYLTSYNNTILGANTYYDDASDEYVLIFNVLENGQTIPRILILSIGLDSNGVFYLRNNSFINVIQFAGMVFEWDVHIEESKVYLRFNTTEATAGFNDLIFYMVANLKTMSWEWRYSDILYRDFEGVPNYVSASGTTAQYQPGFRPGSISFFGYYNLINGDWPNYDTTVCTSEDGSTTEITDPIKATEERISAYPALVDSFYKGKVKETSNYTSLDSYSPFQLHKTATSDHKTVRTGGVVVPVGYEQSGRIDALNNLAETSSLTRSADFNTHVNPNEIDDVGLNYVCEIDGRVWYFIYGRDFNVMYSQIESQTYSGASKYWQKCYQEANPNDDITNSLVATDGGTLTINDLGKVFKVLKYDNSILVFSNNGIWSISGESNKYFTPLSYTVNKVSDIKILTKRSACVTERGLFLLSSSGLHLLTREGIVNLSENRVDAEIDKILESSQEGDSMVWHKPTSRLFISFRKDEDTNPLADTHTLVYDAKLNCFYTWDLYTGTDEESSSPTNGGKLSARRTPISLMCFVNDVNIHCLTAIPDYNSSSTPPYEVLVQPYKFDSGDLYVYTQRRRGSYSSYLDVSLHDFDYKTKYDIGDGIVVDGHSNYKSFVTINKASNPFFLDKQIEDFTIAYENGPYSNYGPTSAVDSSGVERFVTPKFFMSVTWDWSDQPSILLEQVKADIKVPYQETYKDKSVHIAQRNIPGKGKNVSMTFEVPSDTVSSGFRIHVLASNLSLARK